MDFTDQQQIKEYCLEALEITEQYGIHEGLSYLIGEKFYLVHKNLRKAENQARFAYEHEKEHGNNADPKGREDFKLSYALTISKTYRFRLARIKSLEKTQSQFIQEIKDFFDTQDIMEYLNSYPRLGAKQKSNDSPPSPMTTKDVLAEIDDILIVESMKKTFA